MIPAKKIEMLKERVKKECQECTGTGCIHCGRKFSRLMRYAKADVPMDYWDLPFRNFQGDPNFKKAITIRILNIDKMYEQGESLGFVGNFGTGKTFAACAILKKAIVSGYQSQYVHMADIVNSLVSKETDNHQYFEHLVNVDFLVVDEFDKRAVFPSEKVEQLFGQNLERLLRSRFQNQMPTILCSNTENLDNVLSADFARAFSSLRKQYLKVFVVAGKDFRKCH